MPYDSPTEKIITSQNEVAAHIVFNQPEKRNAVSLEMWQAVEGAVDAFRDDSSVRVLVLSGAGGKAFVSGADISKFGSERASEEARTEYNDTLARVYEKIQAFPKPVIAQIDGYCIGGGLGLAVCCDIRICGTSSQFAIPAAKLGLGYGFPGINRLANLVGPAFTKEFFFTARRFDAEECRMMGLVNRIVADGEVEAAALEMAAQIGANAPLTVNSVKYIVNQTQLDESVRDLDKCAELVRGCFESQDYIEGRTAFMEKRKPKFIGA